MVIIRNPRPEKEKHGDWREAKADTHRHVLLSPMCLGPAILGDSVGDKATREGQLLPSWGAG